MLFAKNSADRSVVINSAANTGGATPSTLESPEGNVIIAFKTFLVFSLGSVGFSRKSLNTSLLMQQTCKHRLIYLYVCM